MTEAVPWVKWHFDKWRGDNGLRKCSLAARGLWMELLCIMHEATPYGHLVVNMKPLSDRDVAQFVGSSSVKEVKMLMSSLRDAGVFSETSTGVVYSRRLVRDNEIRGKSIVNGKSGGNPALKRVNPILQPPREEDLSDPLKIEKEEEKEREEERQKASLREAKKSAARGGRLAEDWTPGSEGGTFARNLGLDPKATFAVFRDYWLAKAGKDAMKVDWAATWKNWCRREAERTGAKPAVANDLLRPPRGSFLPTVSGGL